MKPQITLEHQNALQWFSDNANQDVNWPEKLGNLYLANKAKGIHKPAGYKYALSIRKSLDSPYRDVMRQIDDLTWLLEYAQEGDDVNYFTNRALQACMQDSIPVGVFLQIKKKPGARYTVLGLGKVIEWNSGVFKIREHRLIAGAHVPEY